MSIKVSICIPTFNRKNYLKETLASVFAQTCRASEVVVVDDGSTDGTEKMIKDSAYDVKYHWQKNSGEAATRNKLVQLAQGDYIAFIDSDDLLMPDAIERMVNTVESEKEDVVVYGSYIGIDENGHISNRPHKKLYSGFITSQLFQDILVHPNGSMFPKKALEKVGGFDESLRISTDYNTELKLSLNYKFIALKEPTFKHRRHSSNMSARSTANRIAELEVLERFYFELGGKSAVPQKAAMKRLAREGCRAGKCAILEGKYELASELLRTALNRNFTVKTLSYYLYARLKQRGRTENRGDRT